MQKKLTNKDSLFGKLLKKDVPTNNIVPHDSVIDCITGTSITSSNGKFKAYGPIKHKFSMTVWLVKMFRRNLEQLENILTNATKK
uniref:Uncharacterized protein n=1 Tax=Strigamia maritima TaxID=126957 RepID=T1IGY7_STRMM